MFSHSLLVHLYFLPIFALIVSVTPVRIAEGPEAMDGKDCSMPCVLDPCRVTPQPYANSP
jgi:hypothetical protein